MYKNCDFINDKIDQGKNGQKIVRYIIENSLDFDGLKCNNEI
jgi:hypothetical protein